MTTAELVQLYKLRLNPFQAGELCPKTEQDLDLYVKVDGFAKEADRIKKSAARVKEQSLILVYGPPGCGRSSIVNYTIHHLPSPAGFEMERIVGKVADEEPMQAVRHVLDKLRGLLKQKKVLGGQPDLNENYQKYIVETDDPPPGGMAKDIFDDSVTALSGLNILPMVVMEGVKTYAQVVKAATAFAASEALLFTTENKSIYESFGSHGYPGFRVRVDELSYAEIVAFLEQRWRMAADDAKAVHPFEAHAIAKVFSTKPWSFRAVTEIMQAVWETFGENLKEADPAPPAPPVVPKEVIVDAAFDYMMNLVSGAK